MSELARTFFALPVPVEPRAELVAAQRRMKRADMGRLPLRWTREDQLHITLKFLGNVARDRLAGLAEVAAVLAARSCPLELHAEAVAAFGRPNRARALVVSIAHNAELDALAKALDDAAFELGVPRDERAFRPHVTLARIKRPGNARAFLEDAKLVPLSIRFNELVFYESVLSPDGGVYTVLRSFTLGGSP
jgi:2'-5' RNA ligase